MKVCTDVDLLFIQGNSQLSMAIFADGRYISNRVVDDLSQIFV